MLNKPDKGKFYRMAAVLTVIAFAVAQLLSWLVGCMLGE